MPRHLLIHRMLRAAELCATVIALFVVSSALLPVLGGADTVQDPEASTLVGRVLYWLIYAFTLLQCAIRPRQLLRGLRENPLVPILVAIALLSVLWSLDPVITLRHTVYLGIWTLFGLYLGSRYGSTELLGLLAVVLGVIGASSVLFALMLPQYGVMAYGVNELAWQGVFGQKNLLGQDMLLAAIVFALLAAREGRFRFLALPGVALAILLIVLSRSMTALVVLGALVVATPLARLLREGRARSVVVALVVCGALVVGALIGATQRELVVNAVGRDATLTGRTSLWSAVIERIAKRPLLGYGYGVSWVHGTEPNEEIRAAIGWDSPTAHNGFLDWWLDLGLLGVAVFATALVLALRRAWGRWTRPPRVEGLWPLAFLVAIILIDLTESPLYKEYFVWTLFVYAATVSRRD